MGGVKGLKQSAETRRKKSLALKGRVPWNKGLKGYSLNNGNGFPDSVKENISKGMKGKLKGRTPWNKGLKGYKRRKKKEELITS